MRPCKNPFDSDNFTVIPVIGASPAVAANYIGAVPVNARSTLSLLSFQLVTDANVASRFCEIQLHRGADVYILGNSSYAQAATKTVKHIASPQHDTAYAATTNTALFPLPDIPLFLEGDTVRIVVIDIQAADQLSAIRLTWKVWPYEQ